MRLLHRYLRQTSIYWWFLITTICLPLSNNLFDLFNFGNSRKVLAVLKYELFKEFRYGICNATLLFIFLQFGKKLSELLTKCLPIFNKLKCWHLHLHRCQILKSAINQPILYHNKLLLFYQLWAIYNNWVFASRTTQMIRVTLRILCLIQKIIHRSAKYFKYIKFYIFQIQSINFIDLIILEWLILFLIN